MSSGISSIIRYGILEGDVTGRIIESNPFLQVEITKGAETGIIRTRLVGEYNLPNVLAAVCVGKYFNVPDAQIKKACEAYNPSNSRSQLIEKDSNQIIMDAYNANPSSMRSAIENFAQLTSGQKVVMLGAMAELGSDSLEEHKELVRLIEKYSWKNVVLVGGDFAKVLHSYIYFNNALEAKEWYRQQHFTNTTVLVKGSRSMQMEEVLNRD
jgi:UDP-N-acetylmuramoyl-tripeptide--D-alanyl-D-alanine ligase